jgi:gamma-glutamylcyclotransferase (GGCT)/AIG2-like uncharacterized protein YtfP
VNLLELETRYDAPKVYYFAYGMLTDPRNMYGAEMVGRAELRNHVLEFRRFATVVPSAGNHMYGVLWELPPGYLSRLDRLEGYPEMYDRRTVPVTCEGKKYIAEMYVMTPAYTQYFHHHRAVPGLEYLKQLAKGYIHAGIPNSQLHDAVRAVARQDFANN